MSPSGKVFFFIGCCVVLALWYLPLQAGSPLLWEPFISLALRANDASTFEKAETLFQQIHTSGKELDPNNRRLAWGLMRLSGFHLRQGHLAKAETRQMQVLRLLEKRQGSSDLLFLVTPLKNLATIWLTQGHIPQARQSLERALDITKKANGPFHLLTLRILEQLAKIYLLQGDLQRSHHLHQHIAEIQEHALMPDTPGHGIILARLAKHYHQTNQGDLAVPLLHQAKGILMQARGPYHSARVEVLTNLADLSERDPLQAQGGPIQTVELLKSVLAISENMKGASHPDLVPILKKLAEHYQKTGKRDQSRPLIMRIITLVEKLYGPDHTETAEAVLALADNLRRGNQPEPALPLYNRAMMIFQTPFPSLTDTSKALPLEQQNTLQHMKNRGLVNALIGLAKTQQTLGNIITAEENYREAIKIIEKTFGSKHPRYRTAYQEHANLLKEVEKTQTIHLNLVDFLQQVYIMRKRLLALGNDPPPKSLELEPRAKTALKMEVHPFYPPTSTETSQDVLDRLLFPPAAPRSSTRPDTNNTLDERQQY